MKLTEKYQPAIVPALNLATNWRPDSIISASGKLWNHKSDRVEAKQIFSYTRIIIINCLGQWKGDAWIMKNIFCLRAFTKLHNLLPHSSPVLFQKHHRCCKITVFQLRATHIQHTHWELKLCVRVVWQFAFLVQCKKVSSAECAAMCRGSSCSCGHQGTEVNDYGQWIIPAFEYIW
jgi:hypothetical protein